MTLPLVASYTSRLGFHIRAGSDAADYQDFIDMMNKLDTTSGFGLYTEATKPTPMYNGHYILCTDTGKHYYYSGGVMTNGVFTASGAWVEDTYTTVLQLSGSQGNVIFGAKRTSDIPYGVGYLNGLSANLPSASDIAIGTAIDMSVSTAFTLTATTNVLVDLTTIHSAHGVNGLTTFDATTCANRVLSSVDAAIEWHIFDGVTDLGVIGRSGPYSSSTIETDRNDFKAVYNLASGSHTLAVKGTTRTVQSVAAANYKTQLILAYLAVTVSG